MSVWISWFNGMWNTLCLPIAFLLFCASLKYFVGVKINEIEWVDFFAELAIDLLAVLASFIIGRYIVESSTNNVLIGCFAKLAWIAVFMVVLSLIRRKVNHLLQRSELQYFAIGFAVLLEYAFVVVMEEFIIVVAVIVSVIAVAFSSFSLFLTYRKIKNNKNVTNNLITIQRENVENKVFQSSEPLITDPGFFTDANHLLLSASKDMVIHRKLPDFSFFEEMAIDLSQVEIKQNTIACLMPFNRKFDKIKFALEDVCKTQGYTFRRSDDELIADNTDLRKSIIRMILEAEVILAVLDGRNPNVYYEIGIAHSMGKLVLMVANLNREDSKNLPADILSNRLITYNDVHDLKVKLTKTLKAIQYDD